MCCVLERSAGCLFCLLQKCSGYSQRNQEWVVVPDAVFSNNDSIVAAVAPAAAIVVAVEVVVAVVVEVVVVVVVIVGGYIVS